MTNTAPDNQSDSAAEKPEALLDLLALPSVAQTPEAGVGDEVPHDEPEFGAEHEAQSRPPNLALAQDPEKHPAKHTDEPKKKHIVAQPLGRPRLVFGDAGSDEEHEHVVLQRVADGETHDRLVVAFEQKRGCPEQQHERQIERTPAQQMTPLLRQRDEPASQRHHVNDETHPTGW